MKLKTLLTAALALLAASLIALPESADAKRFGGGSSLGKQYKTMPRQTTPQTPSQSQVASTARTPQTSGASRWLGPLAGLAAGGLLASLFFGDAFQGFQPMDFLLIAALAFGAFMLFRMLRRGQARAGALGPAVAGGYARNPGPDFGQTAGGPRSDSIIPPAMGTAALQGAGGDQYPDWFDGASFIEGAKTHFIRLQAAWDRGDFRDIRDYTTPQLFAELQREREGLGGTQYTEVVRLQAELLGLQRDDDMAVASIRFSGLIREEDKGTAQQFDEIWHIQHPWATPEGDWYITGIQQ